MTTPKFKAGDTVSNGHTSYTVIVAEPDIYGDVVVRKHDGQYTFRCQDDLTLAPRRYVVEMRVPKPGDRWLPCGDDQPTSWISDGAYHTVPVVVGEAS